MQPTNQLIQWPRAQYWDKAWNPIIGCDPISPACEHCYALSLIRRFHPNMPLTPRSTKRTTPPKSKVVFCGNLTDLFGDWIKHNVGCELIRATMPYRDATYLWLTKRPLNMGRILSTPMFSASVLRNHFFGFTAENSDWYNNRDVDFQFTAPEWVNYWLSCEPLLGPINLMLMPQRLPSWVVVGCESGPLRRPCKLEWVRDIVQQCQMYGVPVFVKQLDLDGECVKDIERFPEDLRFRQVPWEVK